MQVLAISDQQQMIFSPSKTLTSLRIKMCGVCSLLVNIFCSFQEYSPTEVKDFKEYLSVKKGFRF
jgi:hypothetical protein